MEAWPGDIWFLRRGRGGLFSKARPALIISRIDEWGYLIAPITTHYSTNAESISIPAGSLNSLRENSYVVPNWVSTIDRYQLGFSVGAVCDARLREITSQIRGVMDRALTIEEHETLV